jgi:hypothetical protein
MGQGEVIRVAALLRALEEEEEQQLYLRLGGEEVAQVTITDDDRFSGGSWSLSTARQT